MPLFQKFLSCPPHTYFMKKLFPLLLFLALFACKNEPPSTGASESEATEKTAEHTPAGDWQILFDGSSTNQWRGYGKDHFPAKGWIIDGDQLVIQKTPNPRPPGFGGDLITKEKFGNFELELEFMLTDTANSGIFYFVIEEEGADIWNNAPEFQILDDKTYSEMGPEKPNPIHLSGSNYDLQPAPSGLLKPVGEWNRANIIHKDGHVEHWLNGTKTCEYQVGSPEWEALVEKSKFKDYPNYGRTKEGHIGLQDHDHEVRFRKIRIRSL